MSRGGTRVGLPVILEELSPHNADVLMLLAQAPLMSTEVIRPLAGLGSNATAYRTVKALRDHGLIRSLRPRESSIPSPLLHYLTELGIAAVARSRRLDARHLALRYRLRPEDIARRIDALPHLTSLYALAASLVPRGGILWRWVSPWRRRYFKLSAKSIQRVSLPAYAEIDNGTGVPCPYLLLPHRQELPLSGYASTVAGLGEYAVFSGGDVPNLVVATDKHQVSDWEELLDDPGGKGVLAPLPGYVFTWEEVGEGLASVVQPRPTALAHLAQVPVRSAEALGASQAYHRALGRRHGEVANRTPSPVNRQLMELIARHPFLEVDELAIVMGWTCYTLSRARRRMSRSGFIRELGANEATLNEATLEATLGEGKRPSELTVPGLEVLAAGVGLTPTQAVAALGLSGGDPDEPFGQRAALARNFAHTVGVNAVFVGLYRVIAAWRRAGFEYHISNWQSAAACARRDMRPDGRGELWLGEVRYDFYLEYDRATESEAQLIWKFDAYRRFYENWAKASQPTVLVVTRSSASEARIARALLAACTGWGHLLPVLITTEERIGSQRDGLLGCIWREPVDRGRRHWLRRPPRVTSLGFGSPPSESHRWSVASNA